MTKKRLTLDQTAMLIAVLQAGAEKLGITREQLQKRFESAGEGVVQEIFRMGMDVLNAAFGDYDLKNRQPGEFYMMTVETLAEIFNMPVDEVRQLDSDTIIGMVEELVASEMEGRLGKYVGATIRPITSLISLAIAKVSERIELTLLALPSGAFSGGMTGYSFDLAADSESSPTNSAASNLDEPSLSSAA